ncbi:hypothetical protein JTB14_028167 [Gonioctena quinquepunctata]|nr:hypothetical protein JTB14_028167 [Gonioctena quinquepunctata]
MESENFNPKKCCVPDCEDLYSKRHRFPRPDREVELFKIWVDKVKNPLFNGKTDEQIYKTYLVCDVNFRNDFKVVSHRGLSKIAFPTLYLLESSNGNIEDNQIPVKRAKVDNLIDEVTIDQEQGSKFLVPIINPGEGTSTSRLELHEIHSHNAVGNSSSCASLIVGEKKSEKEKKEKLKSIILEDTPSPKPKRPKNEVQEDLLNENRKKNEPRDLAEPTPPEVPEKEKEENPEAKRQKFNLEEYLGKRKTFF